MTTLGPAALQAWQSPSMKFKGFFDETTPRLVALLELPRGAQRLKADICTIRKRMGKYQLLCIIFRTVDSPWTHRPTRYLYINMFLWVRESLKILGRIHGTKGHMQRDWLDTQSKFCVNFVDNAVTPLTYPQVGNLGMLCYMSKLLVIFESIDESSGRRWYSVRSMCCAYQSFLKVTINCTRTISSVKLPLIIVVFFSNNVKFLLKKL